MPNWNKYCETCQGIAEEYVKYLQSKGMSKEEIEKYIQNMTSVMFSHDMTKKYVEERGIR